MKYTALCKFDLSSSTRNDAVEELLELFPFGVKTRSLLGRCPRGKGAGRGNGGSQGIALPHCRSILVDRLTIAVGRSGKGIGWPEEKVHTIILFISPVKPNGPEEHSAFLNHIAGCIRSSGDLLDRRIPWKAFRAAGF